MSLLGCCHIWPGFLRHRRHRHWTLTAGGRSQPLPGTYGKAGIFVSLANGFHQATLLGRKSRLRRKTVCQEAEWPRVSRDPGAPAREVASGHWYEDCVFRVWGYQTPQLISVEGTILWGWVRTLDLAPRRATGNRTGLFTHLVEVESWPGLRGLRLRPRARGDRKG